MSIVQYSMTRVRSILFTLVCLALLVLPGQAVARVGRGAAVTVGTSATPLRDESVPQTAVDPRVCGGNRDRHWGRFRWRGRSPRMRGKPQPPSGRGRL